LVDDYARAARSEFRLSGRAAVRRRIDRLDAVIERVRETYDRWLGVPGWKRTVGYAALIGASIGLGAVAGPLPFTLASLGTFCAEQPTYGGWLVKKWGQFSRRYPGPAVRIISRVYRTGKGKLLAAGFLTFAASEIAFWAGSALGAPAVVGAGMLAFAGVMAADFVYVGVFRHHGHRKAALARAAKRQSGLDGTSPQHQVDATSPEAAAPLTGRRAPSPSPRLTLPGRAPGPERQQGGNGPLGL
jgi:hypothetical protein